MIKKAALLCEWEWRWNLGTSADQPATNDLTNLHELTLWKLYISGNTSLCNSQLLKSLFFFITEALFSFDFIGFRCDKICSYWHEQKVKADCANSPTEVILRLKCVHYLGHGCFKLQQILRLHPGRLLLKNSSQQTDGWPHVGSVHYSIYCLCVNTQDKEGVTPFNKDVTTQNTFQSINLSLKPQSHYVFS